MRAIDSYCVYCQNMSQFQNLSPSSSLPWDNHQIVGDHNLGYYQASCQNWTALFPILGVLFPFLAPSWFLPLLPNGCALTPVFLCVSSDYIFSFDPALSPLLPSSLLFFCFIYCFISFLNRFHSYSLSMVSSSL